MATPYLKEWGTNCGSQKWPIGPTHKSPELFDDWILSRPAMLGRPKASINQETWLFEDQVSFQLQKCVTTDSKERKSLLKSRPQ